MRRSGGGPAKNRDSKIAHGAKKSREKTSVARKEARADYLESLDRESRSLIAGARSQQTEIGKLEKLIRRLEDDQEKQAEMRKVQQRALRAAVKWLKAADKMKSTEFIKAMPEKKYTATVKVLRQQVSGIQKQSGAAPGADLLIMLASLQVIITALSIWYNRAGKK